MSDERYGLQVWDARIGLPVAPTGDGRPVVRGFTARLSADGLDRVLAARGASGRLDDGIVEVRFPIPHLPDVNARLTLAPGTAGRLRLEIVDIRLGGIFSFGGLVGIALDWLGQRIERQPGVYRVGGREVEIDLSQLAPDAPVRLAAGVRQVRVTPEWIELTCG